MWLWAEKQWHTLTQGKRWAIDDDSSKQDLKTSKLNKITEITSMLLCNLVSQQILTYRLDDEEHGA